MNMSVVSHLFDVAWSYFMLIDMNDRTPFSVCRR